MALTFEIDASLDRTKFLESFRSFCAHHIPIYPKIFLTVNIGDYDSPHGISLHAARFPDFKILYFSSLIYDQLPFANVVNVHVKHKRLSKQDQRLVSRFFKFAAPLCIYSSVFIYCDSSLVLKHVPIYARIAEPPACGLVFFRHYCRQYAFAEIIAILVLGYFDSACFSLKFFLTNPRKNSFFSLQFSGGFYLVARHASSFSSTKLSASFAAAYNALCCSSVRDQPVFASIMCGYYEAAHLDSSSLASVVEPINLRRSFSFSCIRLLRRFSFITGKVIDLILSCLLAISRCFKS